MEALKLLGNTVTGNGWKILAIGLLVIVIALSWYVLIVKGDFNIVNGERNTLEQTVATKEAELSGSKRDIEYLKAWMARDKLDAQAKEAEYNRTMAAKPKYVTQIKYVPTGEKCADYEAIINEARVSE